MENPFALPKPGASADWLIFLSIFVPVALAVGGFIIWFMISRKSRKHRRKHRKRHHRQLNPTLAQTGGLPPLRGPDEPPRGA